MGLDCQISQAGGCSENQHYIQLLHIAHGLYRLRYEEQERLSCDNDFKDRFAKAMSRMPRPMLLEVRDFIYEPKICFTNFGDDESMPIADVRINDHLAGLLDINTLVEPMPWAVMAEHQSDSPLLGLGLALPVLLQESGCVLDRISVQTTACAEDFYPLVRKYFGSSGFDALEHAIKAMGLKSFSFIHRPQSVYQEGNVLSNEDVGAFQKYITAMTNSGRLERLWIELDSDWSEAGAAQLHRLDFGSLVLPRVLHSRSTVRDVHITGLPLYHPELEQFSQNLRRYDVNLDFMTLAHMKLVDGTWNMVAEILSGMDVANKELLY